MASPRVLPAVGALPDRSETSDTHRATVALLVEGWPEGVRACMEALLAHALDDVAVAALDLGNVDDAGDVAQELADAHPERTTVWHVADHPGWGSARAALLRADTAGIHVLIEPPTILEGDAFGPLLSCLDDSGVVGAGLHGAAPSADWRGFEEAGPGEVPALLGDFFAVRRRAALHVGFSPRAHVARNADLEFSLALRDAGLGRLVVPAGELPARQVNHPGYRGADPAHHDRESRRNFERLLRRFRGREDLRVR